MQMGIQLKGSTDLNSQASAASEISNPVGSATCQVRRIEVTQRWLRGKVSRGAIKTGEVGRDDNLADALGKGVVATVEYHG